MDSWLDGSLSVSNILSKVEEGLNSVDNLAAEQLQQRGGSKLVASVNDLSDVDSGVVDSSVALGVESRRMRAQRAGKERAAKAEAKPAEADPPTDLTWAAPEASQAEPSSDKFFDFASTVDGKDEPLTSSTPRVSQPPPGRKGLRSTDPPKPTGNGAVLEDGPEAVPDDPIALKVRFGQIDNENKLLRREVANLTDEVATFATQMRSAQSTLQDTQRRLAASERMASKAQGTQRDEQQRAQKLVERVNQQAKDMQALEDKLLVTEQQVTDLTVEKEMILKDHADSAVAHDGALTALRNELEALKSAKVQTQASKSATEDRLEAMRAEHTAEHTALQQQVQQSAADLAARSAALQEASVRISTLEQQHASLQSEFAEYRTKASQVLQKKEKEIDSLRYGGGAGEGDSAKLIEEQDQLRQELVASNGLVEQLRADLRELEQQQEEDGDLAVNQLRELESALAAAQAAKVASESESARQLKEMTNDLEEAERQRTLLQQESQRGAVELQQLQSEVARLTQTTQGRATAELEEKLRALTGNVVSKQARIEALSSEKSALSLQIEEMERQRRYETRVNIPPRSHRHEEFSGEGGRVRTLKSIFGDFDGGGGKIQATVGTAVHGLDALSIQIGIFLRKFPAARLMVILYMILLHLWVMVVIFTYTPEMHTGLEDGLHDHHPVAPDHVAKIRPRPINIDHGR